MSASRSAARVLKVALPVPLHREFDYQLPAEAEPGVGCRVLVPFGRRTLVGIVTGTGAAEHVDLALKQIVEVLDAEPVLDGPLLALCRWLSQYYLAPLGEVCHGALPASLRRPGGQPTPPEPWWCLAAAGAAVDDGVLRRARRQRAVIHALREGPRSDTALRREAGAPSAVLTTLADRGWIAPALPPAVQIAAGHLELNPGQRAAAEAIGATAGRFAAHLLCGVTGSGKTEVYLSAIEPVVAAGGQALVLVPEIGLTPQLCRRFERRFGTAVGVAHSSLGDAERLRVWSRMRDGELRVALGTRSALFTPLPQPGLIVVDEEHDPSFKQQDGVRYSGRDAAVKRAQLLGVPVVLGSATPSLESMQNARAGRYERIDLPQRAGGASLPELTVCDLRTEAPVDGLAAPVRRRIGATLKRGEQVLVFLNRRGFSPVLMCQACGWCGRCDRCDSRLVLHRGESVLRCHHCGHQRAAPLRCPDCESGRLRPLGEGTERLDGALAGAFPGVPIVRMDRDAVQGRAALGAALERVRAGGPLLLVGTQMLAKGHDFPAVTLAVIANLDQALFSSDFRAPERAAQLLTQVAGRAGRGNRPGTLILQTAHPEHPLFRSVLAEGYLTYAERLLAEREAAALPPFGHLALVRAEAHQRGPAVALLREAADLATPLATGRDVLVYGPMPCVMERRAGRHRQQLLIQSHRRSALHAFLAGWWPAVLALPAARRVRIGIDVDPIEPV